LQTLTDKRSHLVLDQAGKPLDSREAALENLTAVFKHKIGECMETNTVGRLKMTVTESDETGRDQMSRALARIDGAIGKPA
jgi:hypothetical protein